MRNLITYLVSPEIWINLETIIKTSAYYDYNTPLYSTISN